MTKDIRLYNSKKDFKEEEVVLILDKVNPRFKINL